MVSTGASRGVEGVRAGNAIANYIFDHWLKPARRGGRSIPDADFEAQIDAYLQGTAG
jgi:hypothetical protein